MITYSAEMGAITSLYAATAHETALSQGAVSAAVGCPTFRLTPHAVLRSLGTFSRSCKSCSRSCDRPTLMGLDGGSGQDPSNPFFPLQDQYITLHYGANRAEAVVAGAMMRQMQVQALCGRRRPDPNFSCAACRATSCCGVGSPGTRGAKAAATSSCSASTVRKLRDKPAAELRMFNSAGGTPGSVLPDSSGVAAHASSIFLRSQAVAGDTSVANLR